MSESIQNNNEGDIEIIRIPAIISDIDGVLVLGSTPIPEGTQSIKLLQQPLSEIAPNIYPSETNIHIPFVLLTNGGGKSEHEFLKKINKIHGIEGSSLALNENQLIINYTPLKDIILNEYHDKIILIGGQGNIHEVIEHIGQTKYITVQEYMDIYPNIFPIKFRKQNRQQLEIVSKRLNMPPEDIEKEFIQVAGVFLLYDPDNWEDYIQLITDVLTTPNGKVAKHKQEVENLVDHIPLYCVSNDITYQNQFALPRIVFGSFNESLKAVYRVLYQREIKINQYGKPFILTYKYAEGICDKLLHQNNQKNQKEKKVYQISNYYMIGDNPSSDIQGANNAGWTSILVKTGIFKGKDNSEEFPAKFVCPTIKEALEYIFKVENIH